MASGGYPPPLLPNPSPGSSTWAQIASSTFHNSSNSPLHNPQILSKIKESSTEFVRIDGDTISRARHRFQHSLYGKFFGKPPPFDQVKISLMAKWAKIGEIFISDLPNGFLLIRCSSDETVKSLLLDGPWTINGMILQLSPWEPFFEPCFAKLSTATIWVQLHNLPVEFWFDDTLESITAHLGHLLKVDVLTTSHPVEICSSMHRDRSF